MGGASGYGMSLRTESGYNFGYSYLFDYYKATPDIPPLGGQTKIFTIVAPPGLMGLSLFTRLTARVFAGRAYR